jgi:hypothetical protein
LKTPPLRSGVRGGCRFLRALPASRKLEYRRIDRYLSRLRVPNRVERRGGNAWTLSFHRPLSDYVNGLAAAGLALDAMKEIAVPHWDGERSQFIAEGSGEIPLFLALRGVKLAARAPAGALTRSDAS